MSDTHNKLHYGNKQKHLKILELIMVFNHFLAVQARRKNLAAGGQKPEGGAKNQKGGATFLTYCIGCMQQPRGHTWNGGHKFQMGGQAPLPPPLETTL